VEAEEWRKAAEFDERESRDQGEQLRDARWDLEDAEPALKAYQAQRAYRSLCAPAEMERRAPQGLG
jgi:hypothetical protein